MKRAWQIVKVRKLTFNIMVTLSDALKEAWKEAKDKALLLALNGATFTNGMEISVYGFTFTLNRWTKGNCDRVYLNQKAGYKMGYIDLAHHRSCLTGRCAYDAEIAKAILSMDF